MMSGTSVYRLSNAKHIGTRQRLNVRAYIMHADGELMKSTCCSFPFNTAMARLRRHKRALEINPFSGESSRYLGTFTCALK